MNEDNSEPEIKNILNVYLFLAVLGYHCSVGFSLVAARGSYCLVAVRGFVIAVAFFVMQHGLEAAQGSVVAAHGLSS